MPHGNVGNLFRQADGQADVRAIGGMANRRAAILLSRSFPAISVNGVEFPGLAHIMDKTSGDNDISIDVKLGIGAPHLLGDADRKPRHTAEMIRLIAALGLVD